ncbi:HEAT repeat domain-containing protein [Pseudovibrio brasiliensis]|uniref:HEAT repeat domain-containing protein n=1 Tax=Pseudovibrio brasiliensis TaxID=1898042 RepID=A0ABX8AKC5_9HYPH|nr:HEAT repeat domain-containing protein [Pseudovibrio brasiliensis]QUS55537.1 HEAT repeat domain-containing protein [Pseudovibrio brasiliensis]
MTVSTRRLDQEFVIEQTEATDKLVKILCELLANGEEREKCLSAQILGKFGNSTAQAALAEALRDEDEDVRSDAVEALISAGKGLDADVLLWSLLNDPVLEVKLSAIDGLAIVGGTVAEEWLTKLAKDRCEDDVAWDGYGAEWDDWLDVQRKSILALGTLKCEASAATLLEAARDPFGQEVWPEVTVALAEMGVTGLLELTGLASDASARVREHTARALSSAKDERVGEILRALFADADPDVRVAAAEVLMARGEEADLAVLLADSEPQMRRLALKAPGKISYSKLEKVAFEDEEETLRVMALERMASIEITKPDALIERIERSLRSASDVFVAALIPVLAKVENEAATSLLTEIATHRTEEAVLKAFIVLHGEKPSVEGLAVLQEQVTSAEQEIRLAALNSLAKLAEGEGDIADNASVQLVWAVSGKLMPEAHDQDILDTAKEKDPSDLGNNGKGEDKPPRVQIDREGNVIEPQAPEEVVAEDEAIADEPAAEDLVAKVTSGANEVVSEEVPEGAIESAEDLPDNVVAFPGSTLGAILNTEDELEKLAEEPVELGKKDMHFLELANELIEKKRVVPGRPDDPALDIRLLALRICGDAKRPELIDALVSALSDRQMQVRFAASQSLVHLVENGLELSEDAIDRILALPPENDVAVRAMRVELLGTSAKPEAEKVVTAALKDKTDAVSASALKVLAGKAEANIDVRSYLPSPRRRLRVTALELVSAEADSSALDDIFEAAQMENGVLIPGAATCLRCYSQEKVLGAMEQWLEGDLSRKLAALEVLNKYVA